MHYVVEAAGLTYRKTPESKPIRMDNNPMDEAVFRSIERVAQHSRVSPFSGTVWNRVWLGGCDGQCAPHFTLRLSCWSCPRSWWACPPYPRRFFQLPPRQQRCVAGAWKLRAYGLTIILLIARGSTVPLPVRRRRPSRTTEPSRPCWSQGCWARPRPSTALQATAPPPPPPPPLPT